MFRGRDVCGNFGMGPKSPVRIVVREPPTGFGPAQSRRFEPWFANLLPVREPEPLWVHAEAYLQFDVHISWIVDFFLDKCTS